MDRKKLNDLPFMIEEGIYIIKHDVVNRDSDKRVKRQFDSVQIWKKGWLVKVRLYEHDEYQCPSIEICSGFSVSGNLGCHRENKDTWEPLLNALENPTKSIPALLATMELEGIDWIEPKDILAKLMDLGTVSYEGLLMMVRDMGKQDENVFNEWQAKVGLRSAQFC
jgi:hypothetical protein